jgi:predicted O-linked N-acetylglucosamine transferase (SPINDLY family)
MEKDILASALIRSMARDLPVPDLVRTTELLKQQGQLKAVEALYAAWIHHNSDHPLAYAVQFNFAVVLTDTGDLTRARECLERAIAQNPDFMPAYVNLGRVHERQGNVGLAVVQWSAALARTAAVNGAAVGNKTTLLNQSARVLETANQDDAAETVLRDSLELDCHQREPIQHLVALRQRQCKWPVLVPSERIDRIALMKGMSPLSAAAFTDDPLLQLALAAHYDAAEVGTPSGALSAWPRAMASEGPLRIGYLSSDLREHAVGYLMTEVFALHDRRKVEVFAYDCGPEAKDPLRAHFQSTADHWTSVTGMDDAAAAAKMAEDGIQLLVDLNGYTREARLGLVALRPAPVIVNWLGYPGSMGSPYHHFLVADDWIIPEESEVYYSEEVLRLPCYQPSNRNREVAATMPTRTEVGLPGEAVVYCCFNGSHKLNRFTFERWLQVLAEVPGSVLWLLGSTEGANARLREHAAGRGIAPERIVFADKRPNAAHLARYPLADLFLDTAPYGAHTTASDALWMGVPVLTLSGRSFASRVCGSLVRAAGLPELICTSAEEFLRRAVELGRDRTALASLRDRLRSGKGSCTLFDMPGLVARLEALYGEMWARCRAGDLPRPDLAGLEAVLDAGCEVQHEEVEVQAIADYRGFWRELLARRDAYRPIEGQRWRRCVARNGARAVQVGPASDLRAARLDS